MDVVDAHVFYQLYMPQLVRQDETQAAVLDFFVVVHQGYQFVAVVVGWGEG